MRKRRKILDISQEKLAELTGVSTQTVNDIECGRSWVSDKTISNLADVLGVDVFQLFMPENLPNENVETFTMSLLQLRQDIKTDLGAFIEKYINDKFGHFLNENDY